MDADITVTAPNAGQAGDADLWLPGVPVGAVPDSPTTPVLSGTAT